jgi:hypothetical protein
MQQKFFLGVEIQKEMMLTFSEVRGKNKDATELLSMS